MCIHHSIVGLRCKTNKMSTNDHIKDILATQLTGNWAGRAIFDFGLGSRRSKVKFITPQTRQSCHLLSVNRVIQEIQLSTRFMTNYWST